MIVFWHAPFTRIYARCDEAASGNAVLSGGWSPMGIATGAVEFEISNSYESYVSDQCPSEEAPVDMIFLGRGMTIKFDIAKANVTGSSNATPTDRFWDAMGAPTDFNAVGPRFSGTSPPAGMPVKQDFRTWEFLFWSQHYIPYTSTTTPVVQTQWRRVRNCTPVKNTTAFSTRHKSIPVELKVISNHLQSEVTNNLNSLEATGYSEGYTYAQDPPSTGL